MKESPTTSLVNRDSGTRWASCLAVEFDVGELGVLQWSCVRNRASCSLGASKIESPKAIPQGEGSRERTESTCFCVYFFLGTMGAMVGVWSSLSNPVGSCSSIPPHPIPPRRGGISGGFASAITRCSRSSRPTSPSITCSSPSPPPPPRSHRRPRLRPHPPPLRRTHPDRPVQVPSLRRCRGANTAPELISPRTLPS